MKIKVEFTFDISAFDGMSVGGIEEYIKKYPLSFSRSAESIRICSVETISDEEAAKLEEESDADPIIP